MLEDASQRLRKLLFLIRFLEDGLLDVGDQRSVSAA